MTCPDTNGSQIEAPACGLCACPVCGAAGEAFFRSGEDTYFRCGACQARFLDPARHLTRAEEYAHYLNHENQVDDRGYRRFLSRLAGPLLERLEPASNGLDFGCGPGPALAAMLGEAGHEMAVWDPFFATDPAPLAREYDFVTCTETAEHFHHPMQEFERLRACVRPGGWLAIMTCFQTDDDRFARWHYRMDPTHVVFYRQATFEFLAQRWGWALEIPVKDVALLRRPGQQSAFGRSGSCLAPCQPAKPGGSAGAVGTIRPPDRPFSKTA